MPQKRPDSGEKKEMGYDDVLLHLGEFGRYQKRIYFLLCLPTISCAFHKLAGVFLQAKVNHRMLFFIQTHVLCRCLLPYEFANATYPLPPERINMTLPWDSATKSWSSCSRLDTNFTEEYFNARVPANRTVPCQNWVYDPTKYVSSAVTEFDLVCNDAWLRATADALFMVGVLLGSIGFGDLSDRYGRRPIFFISLVLQVAVGLLASVAPEYVSFMIARMVIGATTSGVFLVAYVIAMEMVGPNKRLFAGVVCQFFFTAGYILTALIAYFIDDWRMLQVALSLPGIVFISYWWFVPESARWLLSQGRAEEAKQLIIKAAKENKVTVPEEVLEGLLPPVDKEEIKSTESTKEMKPSLLDLMRHPNLRKKALNIFFNWFVNSGTYYGLSWNTSNLGGNDYLNFFISGAVEIPAYSFLLLTLNRWGRKSILCGCMLVGGVSLLLTLAVPYGDLARIQLAIP
uniref:Major facilitator superfamily (MFS) profile domain-containing protein n=1 Tax=Timema tahoe TaxID=61484 RepID=A0A7R9ICY2_9NEOP|nr:unnamed protein product [Timema tahoe]